MESGGRMELVRYNFHPEVERLLNEQIGEELGAEAAYRAMWLWAGRWDVALPGCRAFFARASLEERGHAEKVMEYIQARGGTVRLPDVARPLVSEWATAEAAVRHALALEHRVNAALLRINTAAEERKDPHLVDWLAKEFLDEQVGAIRDLATLATRLRIAGPSLAHSLVDAQLLAQETARQ